MRKITLIIIHCSAVRPDQVSSAEQIDRWHRARGFRMIGYHYVVRRDGSVERGRPEEAIGAHCTGHNAHSIGICYEGGLDSTGRPADTRTEAQRLTLLRLVGELRSRYPAAIVTGHRTFARKACPCFDAEKEFNPLPPGS